MVIGVPKETFPGERRVALVPLVVPVLANAGLEVIIESGAGAEAGYPDAAYLEKGAKVLPDRSSVFQAAGIVVQVLCYGSNDRTGKADVPLYRSKVRSSSVSCGPSAPRHHSRRSPQAASHRSPSN